MPPESCAGNFRAASSVRPTSRTFQQRQFVERARRQLQVFEHGQLHVLQHRSDENSAPCWNVTP